MAAERCRWDWYEVRFVKRCRPTRWYEGLPCAQLGVGATENVQRMGLGWPQITGDCFMNAGTKNSCRESCSGMTSAASTVAGECFDIEDSK